MRRLSLLFLLACAGKADDSGASDCPATISGRVSHAGFLDAGAPITASAPGKADQSTTADEFGAYTLALSPGDWTLHAELECYVGEQSLTLTDCVDQTVDITTEYLCN